MKESTDLENALKSLWHREQELEKHLDEAVVKEHAYKVAKARAFLCAEGSDKVKEASAVVQTEALFLEWLKADAAREFAVKKHRDVQMAVSARQSLLSANTRTGQLYMHPERP